MLEQVLAGKTILVTAGPTWVPIDQVRIITAIFSGRTGIEIARRAADAGANVTLLLGPGRAAMPECVRQTVRIARFRYFDEFATLLKNELRVRRYDVIVHSAAVSDYRPNQTCTGKIASGADSLAIRLEPTPKLLPMIRRVAPQALLVGFKLEVGRSEDELVRVARQNMHADGSDVVVANDLDQMRDGHTAFIVTGSIRKRVVGKRMIAHGLLETAAALLEKAGDGNSR